MAEEDLSELSLSQYGGTSNRWAPTPWTSQSRPSPQHHGRYTHTPALHYNVGGDERPVRGSTSGLYFSPPGTSYTIVERPHKSNRLFSSSQSSTPRTAPNSTGKKRPMSPEDVLRMFGGPGVGASRSGGGSGNNHLQHHLHHPHQAGAGRRSHSPASSPPSTTHRPYIQNIQDDLIIRTVTMVRPPDSPHGFGICVKGGRDTDLDRVGVYISRVEEGSVAERVGLRPGDSIIEVNGTPFTAITHEEALKMLKSCRKLSMTVRSPNLPQQPQPPQPTSIPSAAGPAVPWLVRQTYSWMDRNGRPVSPPAEYARAAPPVIVTPRWNYGGAVPQRFPPDKYATRKVDLTIDPGQSLGLMIRGGLEYNLGIFITGVDKDSVADRAGLLVGDQILEVNGQSFLDVTHDEAVSQLKIHKKMSVVVRDVGKVPHSCTAYDDLAWDTNSTSSISGRGGGAAIQQMIEEKARVLLNRSELTSLAYYQEEYSAKQMTIEAFVTVLLELLDTPEKHNLFTELREFVVPEDRARFDELVYRRHPSYEYDRSFRRKGADVLSNFHDLPGSGDLLSAVRPCKIPVLVESSAMESAKDDFRTPSEDSGVGLGDASRGSWTTTTSPVVCKQSSDLILSTGSSCSVQDFRSQPARRCSMESLHRLDEDGSMELAHKLSRSFDMKEDQELLESAGGLRRHQSMQRLSRADHNADQHMDNDGLLGAMVVPDQQGNLRITVRKTKPLLGIAIEGGANTKHTLPRIINIHENGAAFESGGLEVGQLILEVDGHKVEGMQHQEVAQLIAEQFARKDRQEIEFLVVEAKKSNLEPKPTALIFLES